MNRLFTRSNLAYAHDIVMAAVSFYAALYLRLGAGMFHYNPDLLWQAGLLFTLVTAVVLRASGLYRGIWRYASLNDLMAIVRGVTLAILVFLPVLFLLTRAEALPRSVPVINWFVLVMLLGGPRFLYRLYKDRRLDLEWTNARVSRVPLLLVGAGDNTELFLRDLGRDPEAAYRVVGIVDDKGSRVGRVIHGVEVMDHLDQIEDVLDRLAREGRPPQRIVITRQHMEGPAVRRLLDVAEKRGLTLSRLPRLTDFQSGAPGRRPEIRPIALEDLLGRPQTVLDRDGMKDLIAGRRVLVTGAGGTIGGELVRQIAAFAPRELVMLDNSEYLLYAIDLEVAERHADLARCAILADVRDGARVERLIAELAPHIVFHAAALKHVPMVEIHPAEGVLTNVVGTRNVADACRRHGVEVMVLISTDKAVNPVSVMGATKRIAEAYCQALDVESRGITRFATVRFGNVLGSAGSVVPLFQRQLAAGGPLTVTHPQVKRYFMTVREAVELVLQASVLRRRAEHDEGKIYVLDMGEPVLIADLARQIIRLAGLRPDQDVKIEYIGLRPGEKLSEELFHESESLAPTPYAGIQLAAPRVGSLERLIQGIAALETAARRGDSAAVRALLGEWVPEFRAISAPPASEKIAR